MLLRAYGRYSWNREKTGSRMRPTLAVFGGKKDILVVLCPLVPYTIFIVLSILSYTSYSPVLSDHASYDKSTVAQLHQYLNCYLHIYTSPIKSLPPHGLINHLLKRLVLVLLLMPHALRVLSIGKPLSLLWFQPFPRLDIL